MTTIQDERRDNFHLLFVLNLIDMTTIQDD